ncbi:L,D-transpeptidase [Motiliproteus sp. MSK22-1]|uniref:L,D-transpeptidase n=1 Tax=Motiliproteus sp. MSK22-1 TaxID=1897630 RepID=UPI0009766CDB|nr:L,D-transpeptidase [Motiliproteus sp. MSK22-1]OMH33602.1 peptidase [Motiliproteus sp. MSK22-1]
MSVDVSLEVSLAEQQLTFIQDQQPVRQFPVSTGLNGCGELTGSECTPRGRHYVRARIGEHQAPGSVFVGRRPTGEIYSPALAQANPDRDWILSRILWLCGCEPGYNRLGNVDSMRRYIYLHGTPDTEPMGIPVSHGCIRMRNEHIIWLFDHTPVGTPVLIRE